ncbi:tRNA dihydrouridine synthase DusB [Ethanoligenens harbinense]|uniref:tRNA-dihydrouridine synthase n=1 Tax=Ethanoligenens harbinense (strain DSM 18485 / JCM 12961 / CGMCC 1.5033 / YUAN-3) TaxID=663278 RepID=E6U6M7_ETHHY|nr:tRNA dihydrouridine synthase DusB [Ethanoligenens harbinense]ADU25760.1 TIM-barrel protein, nifR3 family [Ethanoligenens harbinense YUAN-3]AVQ94930.1 tRNA dihydrouridine synthase DusB [Ethanoligenens harbinense YUAN-3]AYF37622.1 tRNA dihydrouridine synthase DusB [Ethanoligenens harbinense]AYF40342.1 tRNA dihydrouridine synthase DusB [Ethanoligenens harbinense]QCN91178.1 tRNA dihydrouridine synthase DusB [Ethanoligenens harbinense]
MFIGNVEIKGHTALAPMAGVADTAFRTVCKAHGAAYVVGEMASAKGFVMQATKTAELLGVTDAERPMAIQLFGSEPDVMAEAARRALAFSPDIIDINMGCPAPKVAGNGGGSALLKDPALAGRIVRAVANAVPVPVTVKIRKGWDAAHVNAVEIARIAEENGAAAVAVHGRTRAQQYAPPADWDIIAAVRRAVRIPVIGNGDVDSPQAAAHMLAQTGCDLVMIGRAALGRPWLFGQVETYLRTGELLPEPNPARRMAVLLDHVRLLCALKGEHIGMREARKHAAWYMKGLHGAALLRGEANKLDTFADLERLAAAAAKE